MRPLFRSIRHNLRNLARFSGRDARDTFWPYAVTIVLLAFAGTAAAMLPAMAEAMVRMQRFAIAHPQQARVSAGPGAYSLSIEGNHPELLPDLAALTPIIAAVLALATVLLAAAVVRRLHDCGRHGYWGLLPLPFLAGALALLPRAFDAAGRADAAELGLFFAGFFANLLYILSLGLLAVLLAGRGSAGPNRFGPPDRDSP